MLVWYFASFKAFSDGFKLRISPDCSVWQWKEKILYQFGESLGSDIVNYWVIWCTRMWSGGSWGSSGGAYQMTPCLKWPSREPQGSNFLSEHNSGAHWPTDHVYQVWSKSDEKCSSRLFSEKLKTNNNVNLLFMEFDDFICMNRQPNISRVWGLCQVYIGRKTNKTSGLCPDGICRQTNRRWELRYNVKMYK